MSDQAELIVVGIFVLISIVFTYFVVNSQKDEIRNVLEKKGAKNIIISWEPFDCDKSNHTYSVEYEDAAGARHKTTCKVHIWGSSIYWENEDK